jgi:AmmeMemoRadiSam system protein B
MDNAAAIRKPAVAGTFYPADSRRLQEEIESYLGQVTVDRSDKDIVALIAPHAGYMYSGPVAAYSYRQVQGKDYDTVVVISPAHREYFDFSSVFSGQGYETPLGVVSVDGEIVSALDSHPENSVCASGEGHVFSAEHALEVHLPFLQVVLGSFNLVPVVMGSQNRDCCLALGKALAEVLDGKHALIVASSDLSHFHNHEKASSLDMGIVERINSFDPDGLLEDIASRKCEACGAGPIAAAMYAARDLSATTAENLHYATSGETSGDFSQVVGYTAGIIYR